MSSKYSSTKEIKDAQDQKVKNFTSDYYTLCEKYGMQIVQSPLSIADYAPPKEVKKEEPKVVV